MCDVYIILKLKRMKQNERNIREEKGGKVEVMRKMTNLLVFTQVEGNVVISAMDKLIEQCREKLIDYVYSQYRGVYLELPYNICVVPNVQVRTLASDEYIIGLYRINPKSNEKGEFVSLKAREYTNVVSSGLRFPTQKRDINLHIILNLDDINDVVMLYKEFVEIREMLDIESYFYKVRDHFGYQSCYVPNMKLLIELKLRLSRKNMPFPSVGCIVLKNRNVDTANLQNYEVLTRKLITRRETDKKGNTKKYQHVIITVKPYNLLPTVNDNESDKVSTRTVCKKDLKTTDDNGPGLKSLNSNVLKYITVAPQMRYDITPQIGMTLSATPSIIVSMCPIYVYSGYISDITSIEDHGNRARLICKEFRDNITSEITIHRVDGRWTVANQKNDRIKLGTEITLGDFRMFDYTL